ncbi:MAG: tetratricopeptide repeat protein, partial [Bacteroidales bacterium]|nr:tetratricopeptide repeat protein [Bacteroidales bacterium]
MEWLKKIIAWFNETRLTGISGIAISIASLAVALVINKEANRQTGFIIDLLNADAIDIVVNKGEEELTDIEKQKIEMAVERASKTKSANSYFIQGYYYSKIKKQYKKAIKLYKKALKYNPDYAEAYNNMGNTYYAWKGQYEKAIECYQKAIALKPDDAYAYNNMGNAYKNWKRNYKKAIECYQRAIELKPDNAETYYNMGVTYDDWKQDYE